jgi:hypothetical protein
VLLLLLLVVVLLLLLLLLLLPPLLLDVTVSLLSSLLLSPLSLKLFQVASCHSTRRCPSGGGGCPENIHIAQWRVGRRSRASPWHWHGENWSRLGTLDTRGIVSTVAAAASADGTHATTIATTTTAIAQVITSILNYVLRWAATTSEH